MVVSRIRGCRHSESPEINRGDWAYTLFRASKNYSAAAVEPGPCINWCRSLGIFCKTSLKLVSLLSYNKTVTSESKTQGPEPKNCTNPRNHLQNQDWGDSQILNQLQPSEVFCWPYLYKQSLNFLPSFKFVHSCTWSAHVRLYSQLCSAVNFAAWEIQHRINRFPGFFLIP